LADDTISGTSTTNIYKIEISISYLRKIVLTATAIITRQWWRTNTDSSRFITMTTIETSIAF
jgi:hypothetical protein